MLIWDKTLHYITISISLNRPFPNLAVLLIVGLQLANNSCFTNSDLLILEFLGKCLSQVLQGES